MISVSDILKILDQVPIWKTLTALPKRLRDLEERVAKLEGGKARPTAEACPLCEDSMRVTKVADDPTFGIFGMKVHTLTCGGCGHVETRQIDPNKR